MENNLCDDVEYRYSESSQMLYIGLANDDRYYKQPKRAAKYDFGRNADKEAKKVKLLKGLYREPYRDGWKYTVNRKVHPDLVETIIRYANYGRYVDDDGNRIPFTYLRHNRKALGIHYLLERYVAFMTRPRYSYEVFRDHAQVPYFPTPENYDGTNIQPPILGSKYNYRYWTHNAK